MSIPKISLSDEDLDRCYRFSREIIERNDQYVRMLPPGLTKEQEEIVRIQRTMAGKAAEMAFYRFLERYGLYAGNLDEIFAIFPGQTNVDDHDFLTVDKRRVDVKVAMLSFHTRLLVPEDQFRNIPKDFYVGVKMHTPAYVDKYYFKPFPRESFQDMEICGYATYAQLKLLPVNNFGEFPCRALPLNELCDPNDLLPLFGQNMA